MNQHPIPQNVTQYQFKLIGFMTLKQFAMLGGFLLLSFIITKLPLIPGIFKWPIAISFASIGFAIAFIPYEERTLDVWLLNFIKSVYSPTQFIWKKQNKLPDYFSYTTKKATNQLVDQTPRDISVLTSYKETIVPKKKNGFDLKEDEASGKFNKLFETVNVKTVLSPPSKTIDLKPDIKTRESFHLTENKPRAIKSPPSARQVQNILFQNQIKLTQKNLLTGNKFEDEMAAQSEEEVSQFIQHNAGEKIMKNNTQNQSLIQQAPPITPPIEVKSVFPQKNTKTKTVAAQFLSDTNMPITPNAPNIIVGMTLSLDEKLIFNAIVEVKDKNDIPIRAVKSNKLGQFFIATPLKNGEYSISIEHPDYKFDTIKIEARGEIIPPLKIVANT